jgi:hypothetical protein
MSSRLSRPMIRSLVDAVLYKKNETLQFSPSGGVTTPVPPAGESRVWVLRDGKPRAVPLKLGLDDHHFSEVIEDRAQATTSIVTEFHFPALIAYLTMGIVSSKGAMGLMQITPKTYAELRLRALILTGHESGLGPKLGATSAFDIG